MLIKNASASAKRSGPMVLNLRDLGRDALEIVATARRQAEEIINAAREEGQRLAEQARAEGRREGIEAGVVEGRAQGEREAREATLAEFRPRVETLIASWQKTLASWEQERGELLTHAREDVLIFAYELSKQVVHRQVEVDPSVVTDQVRTALELLAAPTAVEVTVHPDDRTHVETVIGELTSRIGGCDHVSLRDDATLARGGCRVTTAGGAVDAALETQLAVIAETLVPKR
jgi:flagellar assembly protein FliH